jgi:hypothetical protein
MSRSGLPLALGAVGVLAALGAARRAAGSPARVGPMMEGFADLTHPRRKMTPLVESPEGIVQFSVGKRDEDGDLELDILQLKVRGKIVSASAGELSLYPQVFAEHNTFTKPEHRGKGHMHRLYAMLLENGFIVVSDQWNHSAPMLAVWRKLAREWWVLVPADEGGEYHVLPGDDPKSRLLDERFIALPLPRDADFAPIRGISRETQGRAAAERMAEEVVGELGLSDWYGDAVVDDEWRPGGGGML